MTVGSTPTVFPPSDCSAVLGAVSTAGLASISRNGTIPAKLEHPLGPASVDASCCQAASLPD